MPQAVKTYQMNCFDPSANSNKVWIGAAFDDGSYEVRWGRVRDGANLQSKRKSFGSASAAEIELEKLRGEKLKKGYRDTEVFAESEIELVKTVDSKTDLAKIAAAEIDGAADETTAELIQYLAEVNIHHIRQTTSIKYNRSSATFSTPLGVLQPSAIDKARTILGRVQNNGLPTGIKNGLKTDYFRLVPRDFGMKIPPLDSLLSAQTEIDEQANILDALDAALKQTTGQGTDAGKVFACKLNKIPHWTEDGKTKFREIRELFKSTVNAGHGRTATLKLKRIYEVEIPAMKQAFDETASKIGGVRNDVWHGTKASNLLSILKGGLIIPPASAVQCTGRMFGNGIYTSLQSSKALNYATNMWNSSGNSNQRTFMFLCEAAFGKTHKPKSSGGNFPAAGTDSTWVEAGSCGVMNHEAIVYRTSQMNLKYLCEFGAD